MFAAPRVALLICPIVAVSALLTIYGSNLRSTGLECDHRRLRFTVLIVVDIGV